MGRNIAWAVAGGLAVALLFGVVAFTGWLKVLGLAIGVTLLIFGRLSKKKGVAWTGGIMAALVLVVMATSVLKVDPEGIKAEKESLRNGAKALDRTYEGTKNVAEENLGDDEGSSEGNVFE